MIAMGNTLCFLTYISTTLPGSAKHCLPSNPNLAKDQPKTVSDILFRITVDGVDRRREVCTVWNIQLRRSHILRPHSDDYDPRPSIDRPFIVLTETKFKMLSTLRPQRLHDGAERRVSVYGNRLGNSSDTVHSHCNDLQPLHNGHCYLCVSYTLTLELLHYRDGT
jgi:hypothetical protein